MKPAKGSVLVTGAAGFIGSHLCEALLLDGYQVTGIDNFDPFYPRNFKEENLKKARSFPLFHFMDGDAGNQSLLGSIPHPIDMVVHLAAKPGVLPSIKDPAAYIQANVVVTNNILEWMKTKGMKKMVFASSSSVYGNNAKIPFEETDGVNEPISPYAFTKRSCELMNYTYHSLYGFDIINLRFFTVYGERQRPDLAIYKFVKNIYNRQPIPVYGDGSTSRDYTYYADTVQGIISAIEYNMSHSNVWQTFNLGNHQPVNLLTLIQTIGKVSGIEPVLVYEDMKPGDVQITYADITKAQAALNYHPMTNLESGLRQFITWFQSENRQA